MAVRVLNKNQGEHFSKGDHSVVFAYWNGLLSGDTGAPMPFSEWADRTIQIGGINPVTGATTVFGTAPAATVSIEGSNDYVPVATASDSLTANAGTWVVLTDQNGVAMTYTTISAAVLKQMTESPAWIRPHVTAGDGTVNLNVALVGRRAQPILTH